MTRFLGLILATLVPRTVHAGSNDDMFNFYKTRDDTDYGPKDWNRVRCDDPDNCVSAAARNACKIKIDCILTTPLVSAARLP